MIRPRTTTSGLSGWARAADGLTVALAVAALYVAAFGGIRIGSLFSMSTPWRALIALALVCGLRHCFVRNPPLHVRVLHAGIDRKSTRLNSSHG